jgi:hypothetical protein
VHHRNRSSPTSGIAAKSGTATPALAGCTVSVGASRRPGTRGTLEDPRHAAHSTSGVQGADTLDSAALRVPAGQTVGGVRQGRIGEGEPMANRSANRVPMSDKPVWARVMRPRIPLVYLDLNHSSSSLVPTTAIQVHASRSATPPQSLVSVRVPEQRPRPLDRLQFGRPPPPPPSNPPWLQPALYASEITSLQSFRSHTTPSSEQAITQKSTPQNTDVATLQGSTFATTQHSMIGIEPVIYQHGTPCGQTDILTWRGRSPGSSHATRR